MKSRILTHLAIVLTASASFAENIISLELRAPASWAGESLGSSGGDWGAGSYLGTFELLNWGASLTGLSADADDLAFHAEVTAVSHLAIVDHAAIQAALANGGVLSLNFQPLPGTVPVVRFLIPSDRDGHTFGLIQQAPGGTIVSSPLFSERDRIGDRGWLAGELLARNCQLQSRMAVLGRRSHRP